MFTRYVQGVARYGNLIKFSHSVFALPFALSMFCVVARYQSVTITQLLFIIGAVVTARTAAMGWNRILDARIDAQNPRTQSREIPSGTISKSGATTLVCVSSGGFFFFSYLLRSHCVVLAPIVLGFLFFYSWTKRFTKYSHLVLGSALSLAPGGVWYALTREFAVLPLFMMGSVSLWVMGFDILYSCQDVVFDKKQGLFSFPAAVGITKSLQIARALHLFSVILLIVFTILSDGGLIAFFGVAAFAIILASQHRLVSANDLTRIDAAFFNRNAWASVLYFVCTLIDTSLRSVPKTLQ